MQPSREDSKEKSHKEDPLDVFSGNYGLTPYDFILALYAQLGTKVWIVDSGTNQHCSNNINLFSAYKPQPLTIYTRNDIAISPGRGSVNLSIKRSFGEFLRVHLTEIRYTPNSLLNMI